MKANPSVNNQRRPIGNISLLLGEKKEQRVRCQADSLVYARGNLVTIKASFTWANNKKGSRICSSRITAVEKTPVDYEASGEL
jgi:hypothetical protein